MAVRKLHAQPTQPSLFDARSSDARALRRPYAWGPLQEVRLQTDGVVPVDWVRPHRKDTALVVRLRENWDVRAFLDTVGTYAEIQTFEEAGFPLLSLTLGVGHTVTGSAAPGHAPGLPGYRFSLLFDFEEEADRRQFEGLARQSRIWVFLVDARGRALGQREIGLTLWNRVQVYQALEAAERIWARGVGGARSFVAARALWEARQERMLNSEDGEGEPRSEDPGVIAPSPPRT